MGQSKLVDEIVNLSDSSTWEGAKREWTLDQVYIAEEPDTCLCGKYPIKEVCILRNENNANIATVGNCCVKKFIGLPSDKIFQAIKRIIEDETKSLNRETLVYAKEKIWVTDWEYRFYYDIMKKRSLSEKQWKLKLRINEKILKRIYINIAIGKQNTA